jgi:hypothetical protein
MGDTTTAMRDSVFYRWHAFINEVYERHKNTLPPYELRKVVYGALFYV